MLYEVITKILDKRFDLRKNLFLYLLSDETQSGHIEVYRQEVYFVLPADFSLRGLCFAGGR